MYCVHPFVFFCCCSYFVEYICCLCFIAIYSYSTGWGPDFFRLLLSNCLNWKINCNDHSSLSSTTAVHIWIISYKLHKIKFVIFLKSVVGLLFTQLFWITKHIWAYCRATAKSIFLYTPYQVTFFANQLMKTKLGIILLVALIVFGVNCDMGRDDARKRLTLYSTKPFNSSLTLTACHKTY